MYLIQRENNHFQNLTKLHDQMKQDFARRQRIEKIVNEQFSSLTYIIVRKFHYFGLKLFR